MNKVILMGRLTRDPEVRYSAGDNSTAVARYTLAVNRRFKRDNEPTADFVPCVAFRNGYGKDVPTIWTECSLSAGYGREEWGAEPGKKYYILTIENIGGMKL